MTQMLGVTFSDTWVFTAYWGRWEHGPEESKLQGGVGKRGKQLDIRTESRERAQERMAVW